MKKLILCMLPMMMLAAACQNKSGEKVPAIDLGNLDTSVAPGDDFYKYATHGWQVANPLGAEYSRFGTFDQLRENNVTRLNDLFASMADMETKKGSIEQKIVDLYKQGLDSTRLNTEGAAPLQKYIAEIQAIADKKAFAQALAKLHLDGEGGLFGAFVEADLMDSDNQILYISQGGLGIGDRDYYVKSENAAIKEGYRIFLNKVLTLAGVENAQAVADNTVAVEDYLAVNSWTREQERDYTKLYNPMSTEQIIKAYPGFDFAAFFEAGGLPAQEKIIVGEPSFFKALSDYVASADLQVLKDYLLAHLVSGGCGALSDDFYAAQFDFYSRQMAGIQEHKPRWKRAMAVPNGVLGEAVGKMYVDRYFPESSKKQMLALVKNLQVALGQHIDELDWMGDETKAKAHDKLDNFTVKIGYPDKWKDYSTLDIDPNVTYYENLRNANRWYVADNLSKLGKPTDRTEWGMTPQTVNAYYNPTTNEICFPAGILQPPFFDMQADDAFNYGAIGVVIGHEMTHGFDDQGRQYDKEGNMNDWWTPQDADNFTARTDRYAAFFSAIKVLPDLNANGRLTLGENLADHGGLQVAYAAFKNATNEQPLTTVDGFTPDQRFFLAYAGVWAGNITEAEIRNLTKIDPHSLGRWRVNGALPHIDAWYEAFNIKPTDKMYLPKEQRLQLW